ncbi:hypothetical protein BpHYR1_024672 [Brachionus plicatilis]|uniref:Uncharacterized protein n=1 Tax=Brachionus plicatilis TaxID=10195 RepID=A0A3M7QVI4_BRAPC|nr:hypothetical protein BpHYR1_024672 [Brachionus plicatilis]
MIVLILKFDLKLQFADLEGFLEKFELTDSNSSNLSCVESDEQINTKKIQHLIQSKLAQN